MKKTHKEMLSNKHLQLLLIAIVLLSGVILCCKTLPLNGRDEFTHFARAYQISEGHLTAQKLPGDTYGGYLPANVAAMIDDFRSGVQSNDEQKVTDAKQKYQKVKDTGTNKTKEEFASAAPYMSVGYLPAVFGILMAKLLHLPLIWYVYLARILTFVTWLVLIGFAVRFIPVGKVFFAALALLPVTLTQAATIGPDALLIGASWLLIALTLRIFSSDEQLTAKQAMLLLILAMLISIVKPGYWLIALFPLALSRQQVSDDSRIVWAFKGGLAGLVGVLAILTYLYGSPVNHALPEILRPGLHVNPNEQLTWILHHPIRHLGQLLRQTYHHEYSQVFPGMVGEITNRAAWLPFMVIKFIFVGLLAALLIVPYKKELATQKLRISVAVLLIIIGTYVLVNTALYVSFTPVGEAWVQGMQGRYFLPLLPLFVIIPACIRYAHNQWLTLVVSTFVLIAFLAGYIQTLHLISIVK